MFRSDNFFAEIGAILVIGLAIGLMKVGLILYDKWIELREK